MKGCPSCSKITRRQMLAQAARWAAFAALAGKGEMLIEAQTVSLRNTARCCIFVNMMGAPSHLDTWDAKMGASWNPPDADIRQYSGGLTLSNTFFPKLSANTKDLLLLRSVRSWEAAHDRGQFYMQTAHPSNPAFIAETPHIGSVVGLEKGGSGPLPPFIALNGSSGQGNTFLSGQDAPFTAPANQGGLTTIQHNYYGNNSQARFEQKYAFLQQLDASLRSNPPHKSMSDFADFYTSAKKLMYDPSIASVFQFSSDDNIRYGNTNLGRAAIVARNAVQAHNGAVFINLAHNGWDTHLNMFDRKYSPNIYTLSTELDTAIGNLVEDLRASGDLNQTLIVMLGEFGRTPGPLNTGGGRDHFKDAMSMAMIGGGVVGNRVIGATSDTGDSITKYGWSANRPVFIEDITATIYSALGINFTKSLTDTPSGRRFEYVPVVSQGYTTTVIEEIFG